MWPSDSMRDFPSSRRSSLSRVERRARWPCPRRSVSTDWLAHSGPSGSEPFFKGRGIKQMVMYWSIRMSGRGTSRVNQYRQAESLSTAGRSTSVELLQEPAIGTHIPTELSARHLSESRTASLRKRTSASVLLPQRNKQKVCCLTSAVG